MVPYLGFYRGVNVSGLHRRVSAGWCEKLLAVRRAQGVEEGHLVQREEECSHGAWAWGSFLFTILKD